MEQDFLTRLEERFSQLPPEKQREKTEEYKARYEALLAEGRTEEQAVAELEARLSIPDVPNPPVSEDYGRINHPKKPLLTGTLYAIALAVVLFGAILMNRLLPG